MKFRLPGQIFHDERLKFFFVNCQKVMRRVVIFLKKNFIKMFLWTGRLKFWHNRGEKNWLKASIFCPMSQTDIKTDFFQKKFLKKTFLWAHRMQFWQPGIVFWRNANRFCSIFNAGKNRKTQKWGSLEKNVVFNKKFYFTKNADLTKQTISFRQKGQVFSRSRSEIAKS